MARDRIATAMPFERMPFDPESHLTDIRMFQEAGFGAVYLIDDERKAIVETGTSHEVGRILEALRAYGLRPADIDAQNVAPKPLDHAARAAVHLQTQPHATE